MSVKLLNDEIITRLKDLFITQMINPVELIYFSSNSDPEMYAESIQLYSEMAEISDGIKLSTYEIEKHSRLAQQYNVQTSPALIICSRDQDEIIDYGIRFLGTPAGYEFSSLIQAILLVSKRDSGLKSDTRKQLSTLQMPLQLKVFVTPT